MADDDRSIRESLVRALALEGYETESAADGVEALAAVREPAAQRLGRDVDELELVGGLQ